VGAVGRFEGAITGRDDVETLILLYKKYKKIWHETYGERVRKLLKLVWKQSGNGKILVLGAGTPVRFPKELDKHMTVVDRDERIKKLWEEEGRTARFVLGDVVDKAKELVDKHDIIVLPAILSWLPEEKRLQLKEVLEKARKEGKVIVAYDTTHMSVGYQNTERKASQVLPEDWHDRYIGGPRLTIPLGIWTVVPRPVLSPAHTVDPGEEHFVEASIHANPESLQQLEEHPEIIELAKRGTKEGLQHSKEVKRYIEKKHWKWLM
jgi:hypothetical protein